MSSENNGNPLPPASHHSSTSPTSSASIDVPASPSKRMSVDDRRRRETFRRAYFTEIGATTRPIDIFEFHDLAVCSGADIDSESIRDAWPADKGEISIDEAYRLFTKLPNMELKIKHTLETVGAEQLPFDLLLKRLQEIEFKNEKKKEEYVNLLMNWQSEGVSGCEALNRFAKTKANLHNINRNLCLQAQKGGQAANGKPAIPVVTTYQEFPVLDGDFSDNDCPSVFVEDLQHSEARSPISKVSHDTLSLAQRQFSVESDRQSDVIDPFIAITSRKSLLIQRYDGTNIAIGHIFAIHHVQTIKIEMTVNTDVDSDLNRFENAIYGVLQKEDTRLIALTMKKDGHKLATEELTLQPGTYVYSLKFCRHIPLAPASPRSAIADPKTRKLTTKFRMAMMNAFDMFDLDGDKLLTFNEFELYNVLSGGGALVEDDWRGLLENFGSRNGGLTIRGFVDVIQTEAETYENAEFRDMWISLQELGFNEDFQIDTCCPVCVTYKATDQPIEILRYDVDYWTPHSEGVIIEHFWDTAHPIPFLRDYPLRLWTNEYFGVLISGVGNKPMLQPICYNLSLQGSTNVNLNVGPDMSVDRVIESANYDILAVGWVVDSSKPWIITVKKSRKDSHCSAASHFTVSSTNNNG